MSPEEVKLTRQRLATERSWKRADLKLARDQFEFQKTQDSKLGLKSLMTPAGGVFIAAALGLVGTAIAKWADNQIEKTKQQTSIILKASEVPATLPPEEQVVHRALNLLWFVEAGFISLPEERVAQLRENAQVKKGEPLPPPAIVPPPTAAPTIDPSVRPSYKLEVPPAPAAQTKAAYKLLQLAVAEINRDVDRRSTPDRILEYLAGTIQNPTLSTPWSAAFVSWLVDKAAPGKLVLSAWVPTLIEDATKKKLILDAQEQPLPGDIVITRLPSQRGHRIGVLYTNSSGTLLSIEGNVFGAIHLREVKAGDSIFVRLRD